MDTPPRRRRKTPDGERRARLVALQGQYIKEMEAAMAQADEPWCEDTRVRYWWDLLGDVASAFVADAQL